MTRWKSFSEDVGNLINGRDKQKCHIVDICRIKGQSVSTCLMRLWKTISYNLNALWFSKWRVVGLDWVPLIFFNNHLTQRRPSMVSATFLYSTLLLHRETIVRFLLRHKNKEITQKKAKANCTKSISRITSLISI